MRFFVLSLRSAALVCALALTACGTVTESYGTLAQARADHVFEQGVLPDILPSSTTSIRVTTNPRLNTSEGEFSFASAEYAAFRRQLSDRIRSRGVFNDLDTFLTRNAGEGYVPAAYSSDRSTWVFLCNEAKGRCVYRMWQQSQG